MKHSTYQYYTREKQTSHTILWENGMTIGYNEVEEGTIPLHQLNPQSRATSRRGQHPGGRRSFDENFFRSCAENAVSLDIIKKREVSTLI